MKLVTSFSPSRSERQNKCLASWLRMGCNVVGVQSPGELDKMNGLYQGVQFIETDQVGDLFGRPELVRVSALIAQAKDEPVLITNSDIEISMTQTLFDDFWKSSKEKELKVGIRWDVHPRTQQRRLFKWGIDVFLITPVMVGLLTDIGMTFGSPAWDYWIPWVLHHAGYKITTWNGAGLFHELHAKGWSKSEYAIGLKLFSDHFGVDQHKLTNMIQILTKRTRTMNWRPKL